MKKIIFILFTIFGQALLAQKFNGFYIEPTVTAKLYTYKASNLPPPLVTDYFTINPMKTIFPVGVNIGLNIGYKLKNNDKLQIGISQDEVLQGVTIQGVSVTSFSPNPLYGQARYSDYGGVACTNLSLIYKKSLFFFQSEKLNKERFLRIHFNLGLSYIYKPNNGIESLTGTNGISYYAPDSSYIDIKVTNWVFPLPLKYSFKLNVGTDFTFGKKDKEWFNLNISFITNNSHGNIFGFSSTQAKVTDKYGKQTQYSYYINGTGNGVYFTLSKRIYPFKIYHDRINRRLEKLKK